MSCFAGLATTAVVKTMINTFPALGPVVTLLKFYLKSQVSNLICNVLCLLLVLMSWMEINLLFFSDNVLFQNLGDSYSGGLPSYATCLLVTLLLLKRYYWNWSTSMLSLTIFNYLWITLKPYCYFVVSGIEDKLYWTPQSRSIPCWILRLQPIRKAFHYQQRMTIESMQN